MAANDGERALLERLFDGDRLSPTLLRSRIDFADLRLREFLGHGTYGVCHAATWRKRAAATKTLHRNRINEIELSFFLRSAEVELKLAPHPNVVQLYGVAWSVEQARIVHVMENCAGGTLAAALQGETAGWSVEHRHHIAAGLVPP